MVQVRLGRCCLPSAEEGAIAGLCAFQGLPGDDGWLHAAACCYSPGPQEAGSRTDQCGPLYLVQVAAVGLFVLASVVRKTAFGHFTSYMNVNKVF